MSGNGICTQFSPLSATGKLMPSVTRTDLKSEVAKLGLEPKKLRANEAKGQIDALQKMLFEN